MKGELEGGPAVVEGEGTMKAWWQAHGSRLLQLWGVGIACSLLVTGASALELSRVPPDPNPRSQ